MVSWIETRNWLLHGEKTGVKIACHRGKFSSSVIENTSRAFLLAVAEGADMVEMDLALTKDGVLIGHHDKTIQRFLHVDHPVSDFTWDEIRQMPLYNYFNEINVSGLETFDEILHALKGKTILVLDRCWDYLDVVYDALLCAEMVDQAVIKFQITNENACAWAAAHPDCVYIPMVRDVGMLPVVEQLRKKTQVVGIEVLPKTPDDAIFSAETAAWLKARGMRIWCNSLSYAKRLKFGAGFDDLLSMSCGGDSGWGELVSRGVDIIQTDWPMEVATYLQQTGHK
jgi:glycerophosphoryl diester phosphodiesterase